MAALRAFDLEPVLVATPSELVAAAVATAVIVAPMSDDDGDCGPVGEIARRFPVADRGIGRSYHGPFGAALRFAAGRARWWI